LWCGRVGIFMLRFDLEDFFYEHEHERGQLNLASSDAAPWRAVDLKSKRVSLALARNFTFGYPDVKTELLPGLRRMCRAPSGIDVLPTSGAAEAIALVMHELAAQEGARDDRPVGIPAPSYGAFKGLAVLLGLPSTTYDYHPERAWQPDIGKLLALSRSCRALVVTNPHNPSGHVIEPKILTQIAAELSANGGVLIVDEVFRVPGETGSAIAFGPDVVTIGSLSKTYGLPGLRLGWITADEARRSRLQTVQQYLTLSPSAMTASLGRAILKTPNRFSRADLIRRNREILTKWATSLAGKVSISTPMGGTTVCLMIDTRVEEGELFELFRKQRVLLAPGIHCFGFGHDHDWRWFRLGYSTGSDTLVKGLKRIGRVVEAVAAH
jgi:aspartate/methionine/tyrosine aminotransferase